MSAEQLSLETLTSRLGGALRQEAFSNRMLIAPGRLDEVGQQVATAFLRFLEAEDEKEARAYGRRLALEGLGHRSVLTMTEALRQVCRESANPATLPSVAGRYVNALLEGYMAGREDDLLRVQERTQRAFQRAWEQQQQRR
jgi:hypothetical protein